MATKMRLKLLIEKNTNKVLFAEAGKDVVDFLFSLLSMPLASIINLLTEEKMVGCIGSLRKSVQSLDDNCFLSDQNKTSLLNPISKKPLFLTGASSTSKGGEGIVKGSITYTVTDDLAVAQMSTISTMALLNKFNVKDVSSLEERTVDLGMKEGLEILRASLQSKMVLTYVFIRQKAVNLKKRQAFTNPNSQNHQPPPKSRNKTLAVACNYPPWIDLPDLPLENILQRLPISGYSRFSAVCRHWRSVQASHRRRHHPSPPPMPLLPWFIPANSLKETVISCYSPFEDQTFSIPLRSSSGRSLAAFTHGWLLSSDPSRLTLTNLISGAKIKLPPKSFHPLSYTGGLITMSPPPNYIVCINNSRNLFLARWFDSKWITLERPPGVIPGKKMVCCGGKVYFFYRVGRFAPYKLLVLDALAAPLTFQYFEMMALPEKSGCTIWATYFVESDGEPLLVRKIGKTLHNVGFEVFRVDYDRKIWVKMGNIGDRVLMLYDSSAVSLLAVDVGARSNCIYFSSALRFREDSAEAGRRLGWKVFDLATKRVSDLLLPNASKIEECSQRLIMPSLC